MSTIQYSATAGEPFLRLPAPFSNIIVTPPRMSDVEPSVAIMGDPAVAQWMGRMGPGSTYTTARAEAWLTALKAQTDAMVEELRGAGPVSGRPLRHIREERADGTDVFIGDVGLVRSGWTEVLDTEQRRRFVAENNARAAGDPEIAWHVGYYLAPSHHGRGLMTIAVKTLITQFGIPLLKTKRIRSSTFQGNYGSLRVLQKNGFVIIDTLVEHVQVGDEKKSLHLMEWLGADSMIP